MNETQFSSSCSPTADAAFGPVVDQCAREFDFTLAFEESILGILPSVLLLLLAPARLLSLRAKRIVNRKHDALHITKLAAIACLGVIQMTVLALWTRDSAPRTNVSLAAAALYVVDTAAFICISYFEHFTSPGPSLLLSIYLILSIVFGIVRSRTLWMIHGNSALAATFTVSVALKVVILLLEERDKTTSETEDRFAPEVTAGMLSRTLFLWLNSLLRSGFSNVLTVDLLPAIDDRLLSEDLIRPFTARWNSASKEAPNALLFTLLATLKWPLLAPVLPKLGLITLNLIQPLLLQAFMSYLKSPDDGTVHQKNIGYGLVGAYALVYICIASFNAWAQQLTYRFVTMVRGTLVAAIYRRTAELSIVGLDDSAAVTLMSTDVERIVQGFTEIHDVWATTIQIGVALFLLFRIVHYVFIAPLLVFVVCGISVGLIGGRAGAKQAGWMKAIEKRIGATSSMLGSMKAVKLSGLSTTMGSNITALRLAEIASARLYRMMLIWIVLLSFLPSAITAAIMFGAYAAIASRSGYVIDSTQIFTSLAIMSLITDPLKNLFQSIPEFLAAVACVGRVQKLLTSTAQSDSRELSKNRNPFSDQNETVNLQNISGNEQAIVIQNGNFGWIGDAVLQDIDMKVAPGSLTMIIGKVGSGKSTLLKAILGEVPMAEGCIALCTDSVAFCDQTPWLTNGTLQANITEFSKYDAAWYATVLRACALEADIAVLPGGDQVLIGSKGVTLSGGQKQRVAIARAVYSRRSIAVFDDVFSGFDAQTQKFVFDHVFGAHGLLKTQNITTILTTHAVHLLPYADKIIALGEDGRIAAQGSFGDLNAQNAYLSRFGIEEKGESSQASGTDEGPDIKPLAASHAAPPPQTVNDMGRRLGDRSVYKYYYSTIGPLNTIIFFGLMLFWTVMLKFPEIWLKWWGDSNERSPGAENGKYLGVYATFQTLGLMTLGLAGWHLLMTIVVVSGTQLHAALLGAVTSAPLSYFASTDTGLILNRFSQDIQLIDAELPLAFFNVAANVFMVIAQAIMILPASYWLALTYPVLVGTLYTIQKYYLRTSRQLRLLDLEAKSPLYSQFIETLAGLATIRAFGWQQQLIERSEERLNRSQKPFYLLFSIQRWLNLVLDLVIAALAVVVTGVAVATRGSPVSTSAGFAGVALFNIMSLGNFMKAAINVWTLLETSIGAVARVKSFEEETPSEHLPNESSVPDEQWPEHGALSFEGVSASYKSGGPAVLNKVSFTVKPRQKVGICGRSGSGKSSLVLAIFRMLELEEGRINVDNTDISFIPRETVRERLNAVPQDTFTFTGTVRENCDPKGRCTDKEIIQTLRDTQIWATIEGKGGLDANMTPDLLSHGERQLFCLARAMIHSSKIIVMDEATSSIDVETDEIIQRLIRERLQDSTVIAVAHRLDTILDFDAVIVMDQGRLIEMDAPQQLLAWPSAFKSLYETYKSGSRVN